MTALNRQLSFPKATIGVRAAGRREADDLIMDSFAGLVMWEGKSTFIRFLNYFICWRIFTPIVALVFLRDDTVPVTILI